MSQVFPNIAITGASGFIGSVLCHKMIASGIPFKASSSSAEKNDCYHMCLRTQRLSPGFFTGSDVLCHVAGVSETRGITERVYREITVDGARWLFQAAVDAGIKRIVLVSSCKAGFEFGTQVSELAPDSPESDYGKTKLEQESVLKELATANGVEYVIFRPSLVYGEAVKGALRTWIRRARYPIPPFPAGGTRSLVSTNDLVSALLLGVAHPYAANQLFYVSDDKEYKVDEMDAAIRACVQAPLRISGFSSFWRSLAVAGDVAKLASIDIGMDSQRFQILTKPSTCSSRHLSTTLGWQPRDSFYSMLPQIVRSLNA